MKPTVISFRTELVLTPNQHEWLMDNINGHVVMDTELSIEGGKFWLEFRRIGHENILHETEPKPMPPEN